MKRRRLVVLAFLLFAVLSLGIGYAALTDTFTISGDLGANINNDNLVVVFDGETANSAAVSKTDGTYCNFATAGGVSAIDGRTTIELSVSGLNTVGQVATADLVVENRSTKFTGTELDAKLTEAEVDYLQLDKEMFKITATWVTSESVDLTLKPNESIVLHIEIQLLKTPTSSVTASKFEITFTATAE